MATREFSTFNPSRFTNGCRSTSGVWKRWRSWNPSSALKLVDTTTHPSGYVTNSSHQSPARGTIGKASISPPTLGSQVALRRIGLHDLCCASKCTVIPACVLVSLMCYNSLSLAAVSPPTRCRKSPVGNFGDIRCGMRFWRPQLRRQTLVFRSSVVHAR